MACRRAARKAVWSADHWVCHSAEQMAGLMDAQLVVETGGHWADGRAGSMVALRDF